MAITLRPATLQDTPALFMICERAAADFARRQGYPWDEDPDDPALWAKRMPMFEYLAVTADQCWVAEDDGDVIAYARSIVRESTRELTEFFVLPGRQSSGVGRELLSLAFPAEGSRRRIIVATSDTRALALYLKAGVYAQFPIFDFRRRPEAAPADSDLSIEPITEAAAVAGELAAIDRQVLGYRRDTDHAWWARQRSGFVARRAGRAVGYGYLGDDSGPFAALAADDMPALLAHAEGLAHARGVTDLGFEVPLINRTGVDYLLRRGYRMQPFFAFLMSDGPVEGFEHYVVFSPPFFV